jgi:uncharacterized membrane protein
MKHRLPALDWMRGIAMVLMASDHASLAFNSGRLVTDSVHLYDPQHELGALQFVLRGLSHICAPTFLFLAGTSLALSIERKKRSLLSSWQIDRDLLLRGLIVLGVDLFVVNWFWTPGLFLLQVMYAIGLSMILMIPLRRLKTPWLIGLALGALVLSELLLGKTLVVASTPPAIVNTLLTQLGVFDTPLESIPLLSAIGLPDKILVLYPVLPWWAMMALGWTFGRYLLQDPDRTRCRWSPARLLLIAGGAGLVLFALLRGANAFGNMGLLRLDGSWIQWLHVSKYPPSLTFTALELGLMALILAGLFKLQGTREGRVRARNPLLLFGQVAFFFYVAHIVILEAAGRALGVYERGGLLEAALATIAVLLVLYPLCLRYRRYKAEHPRSFWRFI